MDQTETVTMHAKVYAPFKIYFDGQAHSVSASNKVGPFDILPRHHNFITLLEPGNLTVRAPGKPDMVMPIQKGVMHVKQNEVKVFLDI